MTAKEKAFFRSEAAKPRRKPQQERAERSIERIMKVTLDLVLKEGYSALNTNRIAQEAEVNISSLYHFFPNKHAILLAIYEQAAAELAAMVHELMLKEMTTPLETGMPRIVRNLFKFIEDRQAVFLRLANEVPELRQTSALMSIENMASQVTYRYLQQHLPQMPESAIRFKMFFCQHMSMALVYQYLLDRPAGISKTAFIAELSRMVIDNMKAGKTKPLPLS